MCGFAAEIESIVSSLFSGSMSSITLSEKLLHGISRAEYALQSPPTPQRAALEPRLTH